MHFALQEMVDGLAAGSVYALIAVGYNMVYGMLGFINFAHGDVYMFTTFVTLSLITSGVPFAAALLIGLCAAGALGYSIERVAYRPLRTSNRIVPTVSAVGMALVLENTAQLIWGPTTRPFPNPLPQGLFHVGGLIVADMEPIIVGTAAVIGLLLYLLVRLTPWGRMVRAIRDDLPTAALMGIRVNAIVSSVYVIGAMLGLISGVLFACYYNSVYVAMGFTGTLNAFTAAVIGGIGSIGGGFAGGLLLGVIQALGVGYIGSGYQNTVTFAVLIALLLVRPNGLFGRARINRA
jgi:branched-chain amino acid transport system permease protein